MELKVSSFERNQICNNVKCVCRNELYNDTKRVYREEELVEFYTSVGNFKEFKLVIVLL